MQAIHPTTRRMHAELRASCTPAQWDALVRSFAADRAAGFSWRLDADALLIRQLGHDYIIDADGTVRHSD
jgi:hypothetical protein